MTISLRLPLVATALTAIAMALCGVLPAPSAASQEAGLTYTDVVFSTGPVKLHGTVIAPAGRGLHPGVVLVAGAGSRQRWSYRQEAEAFARAGIVTLVYDKRANYSRATSNYTDLADDAIAAVAHLRTRTDVELSRVGLWGHSEGGWVAPLAATRSEAVGFVVTVGASALPSDRTQLWSNRTYLAHAGVSPALYAPIGVNLSRMLIAADLFGDVTFDPVATLAHVRQPLLAVFGEYDRSAPPGESLPLFARALRSGGNSHHTLRVIRHADHHLRHSPDGFTDRQSAGHSPGYLPTVTSWINGLASGPPTASADQPPHQAMRSTTPRPLSWYEAVWLQLAVFVLMLVGFLGYPVGAAVARLRGRRARTPMRWTTGLAAAGGVVAVLGAAYYLFWIVATGATEVDATVLGRPPAWLSLQLLAVGVIIAAVSVAAGCIRDRRRPTARLASLLTGVALFVPWSGYWGLLTVT